MSSVYLTNCEDAKVKFDPRPKPGTRLSVSPTYFASANDVMYEIGVKLGHVLWRKVLPDDRDRADKSLLRATYALLHARRYPLAINLLDFGLHTIKKFFSEESRLILLVNLCIAYSESGEGEKAQSILSSVDWSAKSDKFKMAVAALRKDDNAVFALMRKIGKSGDVTRGNYRDWPLFQHYRESPAFAKVFHEVFGEPLKIPEEDAAAAVENLLKEKVANSAEAPPEVKNAKSAGTAPKKRQRKTGK